MKLIDNIKNTFNLFRNRDPTENYFPSKDEYSYGVSTFGSSIPSYRIPPSVTNEKSIIGSIYNQIATDVSNCRIAHVNTDEDGGYVSDRDSALNERLKISANLDQTGKAFIRDLVISMFDEGYVACVPVETDRDPYDSDSERFDILSIRTAKITQWYPYTVKANVYNEYTGQREEVFLPKSRIAIIENPLYSVMNEPNGTLKRLKHKLALLDAVDDQNSSAKLNLIVQLPYVVRGQTKKHQAEERRKDLENQLANSKYGVAYTDGTEKITQINRPLDSNLQGQIEYLTKMLYAQLGLTEEVFNGTANESTMLNYYNRTVEPILQAICDEFRRKFLSTTAISQGQDVAYFKDPFKLVPVAQLATVGDTFIRNEILSANEFRSILGYKPNDNPKSDELRNPNIAYEENQNGSDVSESYDESDQNEEAESSDSGELDLDLELDGLQRLLAGNDEKSQPV